MNRAIAAVLIGMGAALWQPAGAADSADVSPYDRNPACMEKSTDSSQGNCIIQDEGTPRHKYPPRFTEERNRSRAAGSQGVGGDSAAGKASSRGGG